MKSVLLVSDDLYPKLFPLKRKQKKNVVLPIRNNMYFEVNTRAEYVQLHLRV